MNVDMVDTYNIHHGHGLACAVSGISPTVVELRAMDSRPHMILTVFCLPADPKRAIPVEEGFREARLQIQRRWYIHAYRYICVYVYVCICICICICFFIRTRMCVCLCVCIFVYKEKQR